MNEIKVRVNLDGFIIQFSDEEFALCVGGVATPKNIGYSDDCPIDPATNPFSSTSTSGSTFEIGNHRITNTVTDSSGQTTDCEFFVNIFDDTPPDVTDNCERSITRYIPAEGFIEINTKDELFSSEPIDCTSLEYSPSNFRFDCDNVGILSVQTTVTDEGGNSDDCVTTVTIIDDIPPSITCKQNIVLVPFQMLNPSNFYNQVSDNCEILSVTIDPFIPLCNSNLSNVTVIVTDVNGNSNNCTVQIINHCSPTPTNTPSVTSSSTQTPTGTRTSTQTPSQTPSNTQTPTGTRTSTQTSTGTSSNTQTPTATRTSTISGSASLTPSKTTTPSMTSSLIPLDLQTISASSSQFTKTVTPSITPSNSVIPRIEGPETPNNTLGTATPSRTHEIYYFPNESPSRTNNFYYEEEEDSNDPPVTVTLPPIYYDYDLDYEVEEGTDETESPIIVLTLYDIFGNEISDFLDSIEICITPNDNIDADNACLGFQNENGKFVCEDSCLQKSGSKLWYVF